MDNPIYYAATLIIPLIIAIVFHEISHGWVARLLGDPTAADAKRLSLNPLRHVDPIGTVVLPGILALTKAPIFGWAKPVPVNAHRLNNPRRDMMIVAAAGPGSNLVLAAIGAIVLGIMVRWGAGESMAPVAMFLAANINNFIMINVFLALFNLLPIPPFDGSHIVEGLLPDQAARTYSRLRPLGFPLLIVLLLVVPYFFPGLGIVENIVIPPVQWAGGLYYDLVKLVAGVS